MTLTEIVEFLQDQYYDCAEFETNESGGIHVRLREISEVKLDEI